ncbi:ATP-binding protein [Streptomyces sp. enrichment culture]|uniref:ATP-binding protein n=1 Tax=Streptomyces sp. enrichment culture TaxID=1795815 RepID=UPI003F55AAF8
MADYAAVPVQPSGGEVPAPMRWLDLPARRGSVKTARDGVLERLVAWRVPRSLCDDALLIVSELVTNALVHAAGPRVVCGVRLSALEEGPLLRIEVHDYGLPRPDTPPPRPPDPYAESGRGLLIVQELADAWGRGWSARTGGHVIWANLCLRGAVARAAAE